MLEEHQFDKIVFNKYFLFLLFFIFHFVLIFQGFDVTDYGYHFTNQYLLLDYPFSIGDTNAMVILSDFVGGIWLHLIGGPSLFWAKLGGVLLYSLCIFVVFSILENYFPKRDVFICVLISSLFTTMIGSTYIHYFSFPAFLLIIFLWVFNKILLSPRDSREFKVYSVLLGTLFPLICLSRIPLVLSIIVIPLIILYYVFTKRPLLGVIEAIKYAAFGFLVSIGLLAVIFYQLNILPDYINGIVSALSQSASGDVQTFNPTHTFSALVAGYIGDIFIISLAVILFFVGIYVLRNLNRVIAQRWINCLLVLLLITVLAITFYTSRISFVAINLSNAFIGLILIFMGIYFYVDRGENKNLTLLLLASAGLMLINPIGSNCGMLKSLYGFWVALPLALFCMRSIENRVNNHTIKYLSSFIPTLLILMFVSAIFFHGVYIYRDDPNRLHLTHHFQSPQLSGIYSTEDRVMVTDELISVIEEYSSPGDYLLLVNGIPMFHYLTETRPALGEPWICLLSKERIIELEEQREEDGEIQPVLFIYSKVNTRDPYWPHSTIPISVSDQEKLDYFKMRYIEQLNYSHIWENEAFAVYIFPYE